VLQGAGLRIDLLRGVIGLDRDFFADQQRHIPARLFGQVFLGDQGRQDREVNAVAKLAKDGVLLRKLFVISGHQVRPLAGKRIVVARGVTLAVSIQKLVFGHGLDADVAEFEGQTIGIGQSVAGSQSLALRCCAADGDRAGWRVIHVGDSGGCGTGNAFRCAMSVGVAGHDCDRLINFRFGQDIRCACRA